MDPAFPAFSPLRASQLSSLSANSPGKARVECPAFGPSADVLEAVVRNAAFGGKPDMRLNERHVR